MATTNGHDFPQSESEFRPFRLWNSNEKQQVRWRYYSDLRRAHIGAIIETRWSEVGTTIELFDCRTARFLGSYTHRVDRLTFEDPKHGKY